MGREVDTQNKHIDRIGDKASLSLNTSPKAMLSVRYSPRKSTKVS